MRVNDECTLHCFKLDVHLNLLSPVGVVNSIGTTDLQQYQIFALHCSTFNIRISKTHRKGCKVIVIVIPQNISSTKLKAANTILIVPKRQREHTHGKPVRDFGAFYTNNVEAGML